VSANPRAEQFWHVKSLADMSSNEWESLCDGCGKCCLVKLEDADNGDIYHTDVGCKLLDSHSCQCSNYTRRHEFVDDCLKLTADNIGELHWLPNSCSYRILARGGDLPSWHHLVSGNRHLVHSYGVSLRGRVVSELDVADADMEDRIIHWVD
jgi:uncharacterized cysteine cluster protein YcgN (CxxCxxCC family)